MSRTKSIALVVSTLAAVGGAGYGGYSQRHLLLGDGADQNAVASAAGENDAQDGAATKPPMPIIVAAHEEEVGASSLPSNPLRSHSRFDDSVVRGNDEGQSMPAPNFAPTPAPYPDLPPAYDGAGAGPPAVLTPPSALPTEADDAVELRPAPPGEYRPEQFNTPEPAAPQTASAGSRFSDMGDQASEAPTAPSRFSDDGNQLPPPSSLSNAAALGRSALVGEPVDQQPSASDQPIGSGLAAGPTPLHSQPAGPAPLSVGGVGASITRGALGDGTQLEGAARPGAKALDGPQTPSVMIEKFAPPEIQVGKPAKFDIKVQNVGQATAENVVVRDEVPQGTRLIESTPQASIGENDALYWQVGVLRPGEEKIVSMQVMPVGEGEIGSVATVTFSAQASARTTSTRPQLLLECTAPRQVMIGQSLKLNIRLSNPGTGAATNVVLEEDVPDGLVHAAGTALEFEAGTLKPGETRELELTVAAAKAGVVQNVIRARADANLSVQSKADIEVIAPSLAVDVAGPSKRYLERQATHEVIISNPGTAPAKNVEMVAHLPKGLKFVSANNQGQYDATSHAVYWSLEQLNASDKGSVELTTLPIEAGQQKIRVESKADMDLATAQEHVVAVEGLAALFFEVADAADPIEVGGETIYEVRVINQGTKTSTNIRVAATLPRGLKPLEAGGATGGVITGQQIGFEPLARLAPKADALFRIRVQGVEKGNQQINVQLSSDEIPAFNKEESTRVYSDE